MAMKRSSASIRALKAKLRVLKRPTVWGSALILLLPLLILSDYWHHPDKFTFANSDAASNAAGNSTANPPETDALPTISDASTILDLPDAANLSVPNGATSGSPTLKTDLLTALLSNSPSNAANKQPVVSKSSQSRSSRNSFTAPSAEPATVDLSNLFQADTPRPGSQPTNSNSEGDSTTQAETQSSANPLQSAIGRILGQPETSEQATSQPNPQASSQTSFQPGETTQAQTTSNSTNPGYSGYSQPHLSPLPSPASPFSQPSGFQPYVPQTSPAPGTTGYTLPPAFRTTTNTPGFYPNSSSGLSTPSIVPSVRMQPIPGSSPSYGTTPGYGTTVPNSMPSYSAPSYPSPQPQGQTPFSVPRTPPGQYIGGGEINTFSNP